MMLKILYQRGWRASLAGINEDPKLNCQGLGNHWTRRSLHKLVREQAPMVCFLMKTQLDTEGFNNVYGNLPF